MFIFASIWQVDCGVYVGKAASTVVDSVFDLLSSRDVRIEVPLDKEGYTAGPSKTRVQSLSGRHCGLILVHGMLLHTVTNHRPRDPAD